MRRMISEVCALLLVVSFAGCGSLGSRTAISKELGIDVSGGRVVSEFDSHGGFHGDGASCTVLSFSDGEVLEQIKGRGEWHSLPLDEAVSALVYGVTNGTESIGPYLADGDGKVLVPEIREGYYILIDRRTDIDTATGADILHGGSFNFTLGMYDAETDRLYFCRMDT